MKIKLTRKWKQQPYSRSSSAEWGKIWLGCNSSLYTKRKRWIGKASIMIGISHSRTGPNRASVKLARRDAEKLAVELLRDIRDGTKNLMKYYNMGEDN